MPPDKLMRVSAAEPVQANQLECVVDAMPLLAENAARLQAERGVGAHGAPGVAAWGPGTRQRGVGSGPLIGTPLTSRRPDVGASRPATRRSRVDLPQPEGPSSATNSPGFACSEIFSSTGSGWPSSSNAVVDAGCRVRRPWDHLSPAQRQRRLPSEQPFLPAEQAVAHAEQQRDESSSTSPTWRAAPRTCWRRRPSPAPIADTSRGPPSRPSSRPPPARRTMRPCP